MANHIWLAFADGQYLFHLKNKRIAEVEAKCKAGLGDIYARTMTGVYLDTEGQWTVIPQEAKWFNSELVEVVRQGIIGGGKGIVDGTDVIVTEWRANELINHYLDEQPRIELWRIAVPILHATFEGYEEPKKEEPPMEGASSQHETSDTTASSEATATLDT